MASFSCIAEKVEEPFSWADDAEEEVERQAALSWADDAEEEAERKVEACVEAPINQADEFEEHVEELSPATQVVEEYDDADGSEYIMEYDEAADIEYIKRCEDAEDMEYIEEEYDAEDMKYFEEHDDAEYIEEAAVYYLDPVEMLGPTGLRLANTYYDVVINNGHLPAPSCPSPNRPAPSRRSYLNVVQLAYDEDEDEGKDEYDRNDQATGLPSTPPPILSSLAGDEDKGEGKDESDRNDRATDLPSAPPPTLSSPMGESQDEGKDEIDRNDQATGLPTTPPAIPDSPHRRPGQTPHEYFVATVSFRSRLIVQLLKQIFSRLVG